MKPGLNIGGERRKRPCAGIVAVVDRPRRWGDSAKLLLDFLPRDPKSLGNAASPVKTGSCGGSLVTVSAPSFAFATLSETAWKRGCPEIVENLPVTIRVDPSSRSLMMTTAQGRGGQVSRQIARRPSGRGITLRHSGVTRNCGQGDRQSAIGQVARRCCGWRRGGSCRPRRRAR